MFLNCFTFKLFGSALSISLYTCKALVWSPKLCTSWWTNSELILKKEDINIINKMTVITILTQLKTSCSHPNYLAFQLWLVWIICMSIVSWNKFRGKMLALLCINFMSMLKSGQYRLFLFTKGLDFH